MLKENIVCHIGKSGIFDFLIFSMVLGHVLLAVQYVSAEMQISWFFWRFEQITVPKSSKKSKNWKSKKFWQLQILWTYSIPKIMPKASKLKDHNQKNFFTILRILKIWDSFWRKTWISLTKILGFWDFFKIPPSLKSRNFFSTEPISIIFDFLESSISNSFISGVL